MSLHSKSNRTMLMISMALSTVRWWHVSRRAAIFLPIIFLAFVSVPGASGHAGLEETRPDQEQVLPEQPEYLEIIFNEPVSPVDRQFRLFDSAETLITLEPEAVGNSIQVPLTDELAEGSYVLAWRVISSDGHPIGGALAFAIGNGELRRDRCDLRRD